MDNSSPETPETVETPVVLTIQNPLPLDKILREINNQLLLWIGALSLVTFLFALNLFIEKFYELKRSDNQHINFWTYSFGAYNESLISINTLGLLVVLIVLGWFALFMIGGARFSQKTSLEKWQLQLFISVSVLLVIAYIFLTGGILDSPFTSALSIYVGGFLILQERTDTKRFNFWLIVFIILLICIPYCLLYHYSYEMFFFSWKNEHSGMTFTRFWVVLAVTGFSIWQADRINKKIEKIYLESSQN